ncbi:hypothetical protein AB4Z46_25485 [Variovorax sp. M-6]|uniref:hypothetical protein n=1 Tax=Variovorax sp. M-6 TaxID=3233041 RepID=UPI003F9636A4
MYGLARVANTKLGTHVIFSNRLAGALVAASMLGATAHATDTVAFDGDAQTWRISVSPYIWAAGMSGETGANGVGPYPMRSSFDRLVKDVDFSFMGIAEARRGKISLFSDIIFTKLEKKISGRHPAIDDAATITAKAFAGLLGAGYTISSSGENRLDALAGVRVWNASSSVAFTGGALNSTRSKDSATWVNAVVGLRGQYFLSEKFYLTGWSVVGAGQARADWDAMAAIGYNIDRGYSVLAGYRALGVNYRQNGFIYDITQKGPLLGLVVRF